MNRQALSRAISARWKLVAVLGAALLGLGGLYLLVANVFLSAKLGSLAAGSGAVVRYDSAYTLYPSKVHIEGLHISHPAGRWLLAAGDTEIELVPASLVSGPLRVTRVASTVRAFESNRVRLVDAPGSLVAEIDGATWRLRAHAPRARVHVAGAALIGEVTAEVQLDVPDPAARVAEIRGGTVQARGVVVDRRGPALAPLPMEGALTDLAGTLRLDEGATFAARAQVRGADGGPLLDLAGLPPAGSARWALSDVQGQPFTLEAHVSHAHHRLSVQDLHLQSGPLLVRGALHEHRGDRRGAFLVRRGRLGLGLELDGDRADVVLEADDDWLARHLPTPTSL